MAGITATEARSNLYRLIDETAESHQPIVIMGKRNRAVLVTWKLIYTQQAQEDAKKLASSGLKQKAQELLALVADDPYCKPPPFEELIGDISGADSR